MLIHLVSAYDNWLQNKNPVYFFAYYDYQQWIAIIYLLRSAILLNHSLNVDLHLFIII